MEVGNCTCHPPVQGCSSSHRHQIAQVGAGTDKHLLRVPQHLLNPLGMWIGPFLMSPSQPESREGLSTHFPTIQMHNPWGQPEAAAMDKNYLKPSPSISHHLLSTSGKLQWERTNTPSQGMRWLQRWSSHLLCDLTPSQPTVFI